MAHPDLVRDLFLSRLRHALELDEGLPIVWRCRQCREAHAGNLLKQAESWETGDGQTTPSVILRRRDQTPAAGIALLTTPDAQPRWGVGHWARVHGVPLVELRVPPNHPRAMASLRDAVPLPVDVALCTRPTCPRCGVRRVHRQMLVADVPCPGCPRQIRLAVVRDGPPGSPLRGPESFATEESELARDLGALPILYQPYGQEEILTVSNCRTCGYHLGPSEWPQHQTALEAGRAVSLGLGCPRCVRSDKGS